MYLHKQRWRDWASTNRVREIFWPIWRTNSRVTDEAILSSRSCPKFYVVRTPEGSRHEICKGITLNYKNSQIINFNNIRKLIMNNEREKHDEEEEKKEETAEQQ